MGARGEGWGVGGDVGGVGRKVRRARVGSFGFVSWYLAVSVSQIISMYVTRGRCGGVWGPGVAEEVRRYP